MLRSLCVLVALCVSLVLRAQSEGMWDDFVEFVTHNEEMAEQEDWTDRLEELELLHLHPIDLNHATREDLQRLPFLDDGQVTDILSYVMKYGRVRSLYELPLVESLSAVELQWLPLFLKVDEGVAVKDSLTVKSLFGHAKSELLSRIDLPLYHHDGYLRKDGGYRGRRVYNRTRYNFRSDHLQVGLRMERDGGERGIDSYGVYAMLGDVGPLSRLVVGDYKMGFGEGLVLNQGFGMGKSTFQGRPSQGIRGQNGMDEANFFRGVSAAFRLTKTLSFTAFYSYRKGDATLNDVEEGSTDEPTIKTLVTSGYHRTETELSKRHNHAVNLAGGNVQWQSGAWHLGATGYFEHYSKALDPGTATYRAFYPRGQNFGVAGLNYGYGGYRLTLRGETAYSTEQGGLATLNSLHYTFSQRWKVGASVRYYQRQFYSRYAAALCENGSVQNETGAMLRLDAVPFGKTALTAFVDYFYNPWPRYGLTHSSTGWEGMLMLSQPFGRRHVLTLRYNAKSKESASGQPLNHRLRLQWTINDGKRWRYQTTALLHAVQGSVGWGVSQSVRYGLTMRFPLRASLSGAYFKTKDYDSRIYATEYNVAGSVSIPSFYGHGLRAAGTLQYACLSGHVVLELKYGVTKYFDRDTQGSALQTIYSDVKNDITLQLRLRW